MKTCYSNHELIEAVKEFEKNGGVYSNETYRYRSNDMVITCRNGMKAVSKFIADAQQTYRHRSIILHGLYAESLHESIFDRDTLIVGETIFECLQWQEALEWTGQVNCITKKNQILMNTPITIITKKLMSDFPLSGVYYRVLVPFGFKHRLKCMYNYSMSMYCFTENQFVFKEPYANRNITYYETRMIPMDTTINSEDYFCSICLETHDKVYRILPCKHTLCLSCYEHANLLKCHMCRGEVDKMKILYNEEKIIPPPETRSVLRSLLHLKGLIFSNYMAKDHDTFEKMYLKFLKHPQELYICKWPKHPVSRFYGQQLTDFIFVVNAHDNLPESLIIDSLCVNDINIHVLYSCQTQKEKWQHILSTDK